MRLVFIATSPLPYMTPVLNALAKISDLHVLYMARRQVIGAYIDPWGASPEFEHSFYWSVPVHIPRVDFGTHVSLGVSRALRRLAPDVIVLSSWGPTVIEPLVWKSASRRRSVMWAESTRTSGLARGRVANLLRRQVLRTVDTFVTNGTEATNFLSDLGVAEHRIVASCLPSRTDARVKGHPGPSTKFLFVGRLIERKRPMAAIDAIEAVRRVEPTATLTIVGDGPLAPQVSARAAASGGSVRLLGRVEGPDLDAVYASHDVLFFPATREVWGLVVNEALAHGLFVLSTTEVASAVDLLDPESGVLVPPDDEERLIAEAVAATRRPSDAGTRMLRAQRVADCTFENFAGAVLEAAQLALDGRPE